MARSAGINVEVMFIEAVQTNKSKRKIDLDKRNEPAKKQKMLTKPTDDHTQKKQNDFLKLTIPSNIPQLVTKSDETQSVATLDYKIDEVVWAKIKGSPHWPAKITRINSNKMITVYWFNDYRTTKLYKTQLFKFLINFELFVQKFDQHIGLKKAAHEALIYYGSTV